ncbi:MAG TPA: hypothetical protein VFQ75_11790 [Candidatus Limnocylindrales bacterium]|nr:hypothetical protein [Candidatus Limnocylindrales bacterium]
MTAGRHTPDARSRRGPARHERPAIDEAALIAARAGDRMVREARTREAARWLAYLEPLPDSLRDADLGDLRKVALRARAAYGPKDSVRDVLPPDVTEPFLDAIDRLLRELARREVAGG